MRFISIKYHRFLALLGGIALLIWGGSGLLHPIVTTWGPQPAVFFPPQAPLDLQSATPIHEILSKAEITKARAIRIIASHGRSVLQITEDANEPRRYFQLDDGKELVGYDEQHAIFLARHYTNSTAPIASVEWLTDFTPDYPWVNRLLPVFKISFDQKDDLSIYIYTETNSVAGLTNNFRSTLQTGFRWLHSWDWFPRNAEWARVIIIFALVGALLALCLTGLGMLLLIKRTAKAPGLRGWHRIGGYVLVIPLLMFTVSGLFHLLQGAVTPPVKNLRLSPAIDLSEANYPLHEQWRALTEAYDIDTVSIIDDAHGRALYRLGLQRDQHTKMSASHHGEKNDDGNTPSTRDEIRHARYDGAPVTGPAIYLDAQTGKPYQGGDREIAIQLGERFTGVSRDKIEEIQLVTRFGPSYDFRNKRLPVWQVDYGAPVNATIHVDTTTGVLADKTPNSAKPERFSFSYLHKWNFLHPIGRDKQNLILSLFVLAALVFSAGMGVSMDLKRRSRKMPGRNQHTTK